MDPKKKIGNTLRLARRLKAVPREAFSGVSSSNYLGEIERGQKRVTLEKFCEIAQVLGMHPASLLAHALLPPSATDKDRAEMLSEIRKELEELTAAGD